MPFDPYLKPNPPSKEGELAGGGGLLPPRRCGGFFVQPCPHEGHRPAHGGDGVSRREVRAVAGFSDRERRALGRYGLNFEVGCIEAVVIGETEPARFVADRDGDTVSDDFVMLVVAGELAGHAAPPSAVSSAFGGSRTMRPSSG